MSSPSIFSALQKLRSLLTREEKFKWLGIAGFAACTSFLEVVTASLIVVFAQVLSQPEVAQKYLKMLGITKEVSPGRAVFYGAILVGIVYLIKNILAGVEVFYQNFTIQKMNYNFKNKLLHRYAESDYIEHLKRSASQGYQIVTEDSEDIFQKGLVSFASMLSEILVLIFLSAMLVVINPPLAFVIFCIVTVLGLAVSRFMLPRFYSWGATLQKAKLYSAQHLLQFFSGFKEIILLGKRDAFVNFYKDFSFQNSRVQALISATNNLPRMILELLFVGLFVMAISVLCFEHETPSHMIGTLGGYLYVGFRLMPGMNRIVNYMATFKSVLPCIERVYLEFCRTAYQASYMSEPTFLFEGGITLKDVSFRYPNTKKDALSNVSLKIQKGERIGIIGETGSGKSTLVDIILGLLKPYVGSVTIDGKFPTHCYEWHRKIGYVPQNIYLTDDTIAANIAFGESEIDEDRIESAIDAAQLRKFINALPEGVKTVVGERGVRLSGGERQRIAIARALYRNPEVLIFDEATSALDNETESRLMETINSVSKERTVIMIAHRLSTLKNCDRIVVMEGGEVKDLLNYEKIKNTQKTS